MKSPTTASAALCGHSLQKGGENKSHRRCHRPLTTSALYGASPKRTTSTSAIPYLHSLPRQQRQSASRDQEPLPAAGSASPGGSDDRRSRRCSPPTDSCGSAVTNATGAAAAQGSRRGHCPRRCPSPRIAAGRATDASATGLAATTCGRRTRARSSTQEPLTPPQPLADGRFVVRGVHVHNQHPRRPLPLAVPGRAVVTRATIATTAPRRPSLPRGRRR